MRYVGWLLVLILIALGVWWIVSLGQNANQTNNAQDNLGTMETGYIDISPEDAKELIATVSDLVILDVSNLYAEGHIPGAINYYVGDSSLDTAIPSLDNSKPYLVYCHIDSASISGAQKLIDAGFDPIYRLDGNYDAWVSAGYDIET